MWPFASAKLPFEGAASVLSLSLALLFPLLLLRVVFAADASCGSAPGTTVRLRAPPSLLLGFCSELRLKCPPPEVDVPECRSWWTHVWQGREAGIKMVQATARYSISRLDTEWTCRAFLHIKYLSWSATLGIPPLKRCTEDETRALYGK